MDYAPYISSLNRTNEHFDELKGTTYTSQTQRSVFPLAFYCSSVQVQTKDCIAVTYVVYYMDWLAICIEL